MSTPSGSKKRSDLLGRIQQDADRHEAAEAHEALTRAVPENAGQLLVALRQEVQAIRTATEELRALIAEARVVTAELRQAQRRPS